MARSTNGRGRTPRARRGAVAKPGGRARAARKAAAGGRVVQVGLVQMRCGADPDANLARAVRHVEAAARRGATLVCLPELFRSLYFCQSEDHDNFALAEPIPGPTTETLGALAHRLGITIVASVFERRAPGLYHNTAVVLGADGAIVGTYRKMHIPDDPLYYEKFYFTPGDLGFRAWPTATACIGTLVCWDQWYPEAARLTALQGAEILFYPTAIGWHPAEKAEFGADQHAAWETVQRAHAIANGVFVAVPNRVGHERPIGGPGIEFWGRSFVVNPAGRVLARASADREEVMVVACDLAAVETARTHWPFLRDRRVDAYGDLTRRLID
ncbi:MAG TPA: carbon-nitrogen hydrolase [Candidatus Binatia bacterium]|jgi:N-carbamoylputrescine amidase